MGLVEKIKETVAPLKRLGRMSPARLIIFGFLLQILAGSLLLSLPIATQSGERASYLDALFTATSATCVTGLVVQDTATYWSGFGQTVILLLIQIGGMGVVTMAVAIAIFSGRKLGLKQRWVMQEAISAPQVGGIINVTGFILKMAFAIEAIGALLLSFRFCPEFGFWKGIWYSVFHSISAFCNAGFDLMGVKSQYSSLMDYTADPLINLPICLLIVLGGLGFLTWQDISKNGLHFKRYRLQTKLVLVSTAVLLLLPFLYFLFYEFRLPQWQGLSLAERIWGAVFQAVTPRTAGFNTLDLTQMSEPGLVIMIALMLTGGSPGSTAGGFKNTTLLVLILSALAVFRRRRSAHCFGRRIQEQALQSASAIFMLYLMLFITGSILICCIDSVPLMSCLFEAGSAIGTVGLSLVGTASFSAPSRLILIFLMYFGRVGGLTMIYALTAATNPFASQFPQEQVTVG